MVMTLMRILFCLGYSQGKEREGQELEAVLGRGAIMDFGEQRVLGAGFLVGGGLKGADCSLD